MYKRGAVIPHLANIKTTMTDTLKEAFLPEISPL